MKKLGVITEDEEDVRTLNEILKKIEIDDIQTTKFYGDSSGSHKN